MDKIKKIESKATQLEQEDISRNIKRLFKNDSEVLGSEEKRLDDDSGIQARTGDAKIKIINDFQLREDIV